MRTLMATSANSYALPVDGHGRVLLEELASLTDRDAASLARESVVALLGARASVVAAVSTAADGSTTGERQGVVTVREVTEAGVVYRTHTATGASGGEAVGNAVLAAFDAEASFVPAAARRWATDLDVVATTMVRADGRWSFGPVDDTIRHERLMMTMPGAGTLAVDVSDAAYRVLRLPEVALICAMEPGSRVVERFDAWMADVRGRVQC
jgi:hypothetical protein